MRAIVEVLCWWGAGVVLWLVTTSRVDATEAVLALAACLVCAVFARRIRKTLGFRAAPPRAVWAWVLALPRALANDVAAVVRFIVHALRGRAVVGRRHTLRWPSGGSAAAVGWRTSAAIVVSATPATLVLDVDPDAGDVLVHTLLTSSPKLDELVSP